MASGEHPMRRIMIPIDDSANCLRAFNWYRTQMKLANDQIIFVHVIEPVYSTPAMAVAMESPPLLVEDMTRVMKHSIDVGKALSRKYMHLAKEAGIVCKAFLHVDTKSGHAIVKSAVDHQCDTIVIGSRGLGVIKRTLLGSISDYIVHHSHIPVVIVPPEPETS